MSGFPCLEVVWSQEPSLDAGARLAIGESTALGRGADVELSLPGKREFVLWAPLAPEQAVLQKAILGRTTAELYASISAKGCRVSGGASGSATNMLMELRKNCNHPDLITGRLKGETQFPPAEELIAACGKLALLDRMLTRLRAKGHRVLIFSQMVRLLDLLDAFLEARSHPDST